MTRSDRRQQLIAMTTTELRTEWQVTYQTRLGSLCGAAEPTTAEDTMARDEADKACEELKDL